MSEYIEIQRQIAALQEKAALIREAERREAITQINHLVKAFDVRASEVHFARGAFKAKLAPATGSVKRHPTAGVLLPAKYRDEHGNAWSGRGMQPRWLRDAVAGGRPLESFAVSG